MKRLILLLSLGFILGILGSCSNANLPEWPDEAKAFFEDAPFYSASDSYPAAPPSKDCEKKVNEISKKCCLQCGATWSGTHCSYKDMDQLPCHVGCVGENPTPPECE